MKSNISVIILTKNEEDVIGNAVKSVSDFAEEIIVVDSFSNDKTTKIAEELGAKIIKHLFKDFSDQRNYAFPLAKSKWVLYLDADERATVRFKDEISKIIAEPQKENIGGYYINRRIYYFGHDWGVVDRVQRLFLNDRFIEWGGKVHETPKIDGSFGIIHSPVKHFTHRNLSQMIRKTNEWSEVEAKLRFEKNHPRIQAWRFFRVMVSEFLRSYIKERGYKNGTYGVIEAIYQAYSIFITYAKLWEIQSKRGK